MNLNIIIIISFSTCSENLIATAKSIIYHQSYKITTIQACTRYTYTSHFVSAIKIFFVLHLGNIRSSQTKITSVRLLSNTVVWSATSVLSVFIQYLPMLCSLYRSGVWFLVDYYIKIANCNEDANLLIHFSSRCKMILV